MSYTTLSDLLFNVLEFIFILFIFLFWQISKDKIREVLPLVLDTGYRHIDTAFSYNNEEAIGDVLNDYFQDGKLAREDIFVATKVSFLFNLCLL